MARDVVRRADAVWRSLNTRPLLVTAAEPPAPLADAVVDPRTFTRSVARCPPPPGDRPPAGWRALTPRPLPGPAAEPPAPLADAVVDPRTFTRSVAGCLAPPDDAWP